MPQGKLVSKPLRINRPYIRFLIGGGNHPGRTCVNLLVAGRVVRTATGRNSEELLPRTWDVREFIGKQCVIEIVDAHFGGWGHIMVDEIALTDGGGSALKTDPPLGMRSAVTLGGLGAGTIELRGDGSLHDWNIFNNHPHNRTPFGGKVQLEEALFGLRVEGEGLPSRAWALRTHAPGVLPCIEQIEYGGSFPVSRLRFSDQQLPIEVDLYAYSEFHIGNAGASATPAAIFSFQLRNPTDKEVRASVLFHLPNHIEGTFSGERCLVLTRDGNDSIGGSMALQVAGSEQTSCASGAGLAEVWKPFADHGKLGRIGEERASGGISASVSLEPGATRTVTIALGWYFPHKPYWKDSAKQHEIVGNYYANLFTSAEDVVEKVLGRLPATQAAARQWHQLCFENDLPAWLQDSMVNSPATMLRTGMWSRDGRWRQFESFSCPYLDPIHVQLYRSQTFAYFFPGLLKSLLEGFIKTQQADGRIAHDLGRTSGFDIPANYRRQTSSVFLINVYQYYRATGDHEFLEHVWPASKKATEWAIRQSGALKLPTKLQSTYEIKYNYQDGAAYNSFIYLTGLSIAREMARLNGDEEFADRMQGLLDEARGLVDERFWTGEFYRAWWNANGNHPDAIQSDTLYGQLWASVLDLGLLAPRERMKSQLASEKRLTDTPFGLQVCVGREPKPYLWDETVWPAASMTWAALMIYLDGDMDEAMAMAKKSYDNYAARVRDPWDIKDVYAKADGYPSCNSHYGRQNIFWSIPLALAGQQYDAAEKTLSFDPKAGAPASLPWFIPGANGTVKRLDKDTYEVTVLSGELKLAQLQIVNGPAVRDVSLTAGRSLIVQTGSDKPEPVQRDWSALRPVSLDTLSQETVVFSPGKEFLISSGIMRRDPSDVIRHEDQYYVWYTKVESGKPGYPGGWCGTVWYATSPDGETWTERGQAVDRGAEGAWDSAGTYTPNILPYEGKSYLAYTAMRAPFTKKTSQASIGLAVADSPDGPWQKLDSGPVITPGESLDSPDGFLCDDTVFVLRDDRIWLYYKGYPARLEGGRRVRAGGNTFLLAATATNPEGPYTKIPNILHRGHEAMVWKDEDAVGSMGLAFGPKCYFTSRNGIDFSAVHRLKPLKAAGVYRADFEEGSKGARPTWGIAMGKKHGLCRFEIVWPQP